MIITYTLSAVGSLVKETLASAKSLRPWIQEGDIIQAIVTPPYGHFCKHGLEAHGVKAIIRKQNFTEPFKLNMRTGHTSRFAEKLGALSLSRGSNKIIFLDSDTRINGPLEGIFKPGYDLSVRLAPAFQDFDHQAWEDLFKAYSSGPTIPMFNAGLVACQGEDMARDLGRKALVILEEIKGLEPCHPWQHHLDQYALALAASDLGLRINWLTRAQHSYAWLFERPGLVHHGALERKHRLSYALSALRRALA